VIKTRGRWESNEWEMWHACKEWRPIRDGIKTGLRKAWGHRTETIGLGQGSIDGSHEYGNESSGSIKQTEITDQLRVCYLPIKASVTWI
jgi:hypothetical protein